MRPRCPSCGRLIAVPRDTVGRKLKATLAAAAGLPVNKQLYNAVAYLVRAGKLVTVRRGVFTVARRPIDPKAALRPPRR